uniref:Uncharacterized protein n=1 Tax=Anguilla anguilla TaxID=7936 RepID=A0A0E9W6J1_ANGAN
MYKQAYTDPQSQHTHTHTHLVPWCAAERRVARELPLQ